MTQTHAVVIGGSIGGMCAAKALRDQFDHVTVLERDTIPDTIRGRRGAPQGWHNHFLLQRGRDSIEALFPGFGERIIKNGGLDLDPAYDGITMFTDGWVARSRAKMRMMYASRPHLEATVREMLHEVDGIEFRERVQVIGLRHEQTPDGGQRVNGVDLIDADGERTQLDADFVVDAGGRGSKAATWMKELGHDVEVLDLDAKVAYSSRWFKWPENEADRPWWKQLTTFPHPDLDAPAEEQYLCSIFPVENDSFIAVMGSWGVRLPTNNDDFAEAARKTRTPLFAEIMDKSTPLTDVNHTKMTMNIWRRFDRIAAPPRGFVALGDAVCAFNPIYAQGMTCASTGAVMLSELLATHDVADADFATTYYQRQAEFLSGAWTLALTRDGGCEHATGSEVKSDRVSKLKQKLLQRYTWSGFQFITGAGFANEALDTHFGRVFNLQEPVGDLIKDPKVIAALAVHGVRTLIRRPASPALRPPLEGPSTVDYTSRRYRALREEFAQESVG